MSGTLYLFPVWLGEQDTQRVLPAYNLEVMDRLRHVVVENERTARRFLRAWGYKGSFDELELIVADKDNEADVLDGPIGLLLQGHDVGLMSEAGCPGVADPGQRLIAQAQQMNIRVVPLVGPSSILMALMASGLNGQQFSFMGYLPIDRAQRAKALRDMDAAMRRTGGSYIFMETPYRNMALLDDALRHLGQDIRLCVAVDITLPTEQIRTMTVGEWRTHRPDLAKRPCMFVAGK